MCLTCTRWPLCREVNVPQGRWTVGSVSGSLVAAYVVGYLETATAYLISPAYRTIPALLLLVVVMYLRPQGRFGRR